MVVFHVSTFILQLQNGVVFLFGTALEIGLEPIKCGADERRARGLDRAHP